MLVVLAGCRLHVDTVRDGDPVAPGALVALCTGETTLDTLLAVAGAPDGVAWVTSEDVLIYRSSRFHSTRWSLDNPIMFFNKITPQGFVGEIVGAAVFSIGRAGRKLPSRPPPGRPLPQDLPEMMGGWGKPLKLNGEKRGIDELLFFFDRETSLLTRVESSRRAPDATPSAIAEGTFLR